ncbi:thioredoxin-like fold domain-containing protein MRL7 homolog, chloroplastic [Oryza brachyantha]|uniref:Thioredoxin domain-containing protein n=1 Tax=Oryza brachyantha TaxID=4533 RepID=J3L5F8_ORYBR|nr:thioredoxin-like fold domain-containing protein MRL7 homolog, chloroplastic [Oryza brachyantha]XP_006644944.1 thioredoxin-like fold domain-containing protein MRL7 homolog, chloroplastic [Oryza brachyantha]
MLRLPTLLPLKPSAPAAGLNPSRGRQPRRRLLASSAPSTPPPRPPNPTPARGAPKAEPGTSHENLGDGTADFPTTKPRKPRRGRRSEAAAVEDFVRGRLEQVFASIRERSPEVLQGKGDILKRREEDEEDEFSNEEGEEGLGEEEEGEQRTVVEEEDPSWPLDADIGWGIRASEYFDKHSIKNVTVDGVEIDWEGEVEEGWVKEINCLEWESFAFHPSPLVVLVFERYNRAADNWKFLEELEKAAKVYWNSKDRLPPRTVKVDMNIERDLAFALQVEQCPQLLFLRGNKILYREKEIRTADELVQMIAHFYYNAKRPSCVNPEAIASPI